MTTDALTTAENLRRISAANAPKIAADPGRSTVRYRARHRHRHRRGTHRDHHPEYHEPSTRDAHRRIVTFFHEYLDR